MKKILLPYLIWLVFIFIIIYFGTKFFPYNQNFPQYFGCGIEKWRSNKILCSLSNFDGVHYLGIAQLGYAGFEQAFFPLYPLLIRFLSPFFFGIFLFSGLFISHLCFLISLYLFYKLIKLDYNENISKWTILFLVFFPTSFFFGSVYTESLFLMLVLLSFYGARTNKWWLAGIAGMLASATRLVGIFLLPALLIEYYQQLKVKNNKSDSLKIKSLKIENCKFLYLFLIPLGLLSYMYYLWRSTGDPLMFIHSQSIWQRGNFVLLPQVIYRYLKIFLTVNPLSLSFFVALIEFLITISFFILLFLGTKKLRQSYLIYAWLALLTPTLTGTFLSMPRFVLTIFPIFILMSSIKNQILKYILLAVYSTLLAVLTIFFTRGLFVA